jgi:hypothetical protein
MLRSVPKDIPAFRMEENNTADTSLRSVNVVATFERGTGRLGVRCIAVIAMVDRMLMKKSKHWCERNTSIIYTK